MIKACRAELLNLSHRPLIVILSLFATIPTIYAYLADYAGTRAMAAKGITGGGQDAPLLLPHHLVENVVLQLFKGSPPDGAAVGVVLGALIVGSDYAWGTVRTALVQGPSRSVILGGRLVVLAGALGALVAADFAASAVGSVAVAVLSHAPIRFVSTSQLVGGMLSVWLILDAWASLGVFLVIATRSAPAAMGIGITWEAGVEATIQPFAVHSGVMHMLVEWLPKANTDAVATALTPVFSATQPPPMVVIAPEHARLVLAAYLLCALVVSAAVFRWRDVD